MACCSTAWFSSSVKVSIKGMASLQSLQAIVRLPQEQVRNTLVLYGRWCMTSSRTCWSLQNRSFASMKFRHILSMYATCSATSNCFYYACPTSFATSLQLGTRQTGCCGLSSHKAACPLIAMQVYRNSKGSWADASAAVCPAKGHHSERR